MPNRSARTLSSLIAAGGRALLAGAAVFALLSPAATPAAAQRGPAPGAETPRSPQGAGLPGKFDYYSLVLSWSPSHCASLPRDSYDPQCHRRDGRRYAFVVHGLWPQYEKGWPEFCPTRDRPFVPQPLIDKMLDIMPSPKLVIHQYKKHGTCSGVDPAGYFDLTRKLFTKINIPPRYQSLQQPVMVGPGELVQEFLAANPALKPDMIVVDCDERSGNRLKEVRICFTKEGDLRACGRNEDQRRLCSAAKMYVPPVRVPPGGSIGGGAPSNVPPPAGQRSL